MILILDRRKGCNSSSRDLETLQSDEEESSSEVGPKTKAKDGSSKWEEAMDHVGDWELKQWEKKEHKDDEVYQPIPAFKDMNKTEKAKYKRYYWQWTSGKWPPNKPGRKSGQKVQW